ncbi:MAG: hypothetical protein ACRD9R_15140 [Pyrinomonadaceae bacterium]
MGKISKFAKGILFWSYGRTTWQYDVLCVLILAFIFLTPKGWFASSERSHWAAHQNASKTASTLLIEAGDAASSPDTADLERRVQALTGRAGARIKAWRPVTDSAGRTIAYEVDFE